MRKYLKQKDILDYIVRCCSPALVLVESAADRPNVSFDIPILITCDELCPESEYEFTAIADVRVAKILTTALSAEAQRCTHIEVAFEGDMDWHEWWITFSRIKGGPNA